MEGLFCLEVSYLTHIGDRSNQEDTLRVADKVVRGDFEEGRLKVEGNGAVFAVCDGMGGHDFGEVASLWVAERVGSLLDARCEEEIREGIYRIQRESEGVLPENSGTTLAFLLIFGGVAFAGNVGDSRVYVVRGGEMEQVTRDHSVVYEMFLRGEISKEEAREHPMRNLVTLGIGPIFSGEWRGPSNVHVVVLPEFDYALLCTDGVSDNLSDEEMGFLVATFGFDSPREMFSRVRERVPFGLDNFSAVVVRRL